VKTGPKLCSLVRRPLVPSSQTSLNYFNLERGRRDGGRGGAETGEARRGDVAERSSTRFMVGIPIAVACLSGNQQSSDVVEEMV
jgi:hypothetical protein